VAREGDAGTIWINDWAVVHDEFKEGGFNESGKGRLNGLTAFVSLGVFGLGLASLAALRPTGSW
jgi:hypothetical protein